MKLPRYPVYVISKGRADLCYTANFLERDGVPFRIVVEPPDVEKYAARYGDERIIPTDFADLEQGATPARNFTLRHAIASGATSHWILDDNINYVERFHHGKRVPCDSGPVFALVEDLSDRFENVAVSGLNYHMFGIPGSTKRPFSTNVHVYSFILLRHVGIEWRGVYNEDVDLCLQSLARGYATVAVNAFLAYKRPTLPRMPGGNTSVYQSDGFVKKAREIERRWPGVVRIDRRFKRPQHVVDWKKFDVELKLRDGLTIEGLRKLKPDEYGLTLKKNETTERKERQ